MGASHIQIINTLTFSPSFIPNQSNKMGLSIHYSGYISKKEMLDELIEEVTEICRELEWPSQIIHDSRIKGIFFAPEKSEGVFLTFTLEGRLLSPTNILIEDYYDKLGPDRELKYITSTKTQFAGIDAHIAIIKLLKYISNKYLEDFLMNDEGNYWETGDEKVLAAQFEEYNAAMDFVKEALMDIPAKANETPQSLVERLEDLLSKKMRK